MPLPRGSRRVAAQISIETERRVSGRVEVRREFPDQRDEQEIAKADPAAEEEPESGEPDDGPDYAKKGIEADGPERQRGKCLSRLAPGAIVKGSRTAYALLKGTIFRQIQDRRKDIKEPSFHQFDLAASIVIGKKRNREELQRYAEQEFVNKVEIMSSDDSCRKCKAVAGKRYLLNKAPLLPVDGCTHENGCRCCYTPMVD